MEQDAAIKARLPESAAAKLRNIQPPSNNAPIPRMNLAVALENLAGLQQG